MAGIGCHPVEASGALLAGNTETDPNSLKLSGTVMVRIKHVDNELTNTTLEELSFLRIGNSPNWQLADGEGDRVRRLINADR